MQFYSKFRSHGGCLGPAKGIDILELQGWMGYNERTSEIGELIMPVCNKFRPDLTSYRVYIEMLRDGVNESGWNNLTLTDIVKACVEEVLAKKCPGIKIKRDRKTVIHVDY